MEECRRHFGDAEVVALKEGKTDKQWRTIEQGKTEVVIIPWRAAQADGCAETLNQRCNPILVVLDEGSCIERERTGCERVMRTTSAHDARFGIVSATPFHANHVPSKHAPGPADENLPLKVQGVDLFRDSLKANSEKRPSPAGRTSQSTQTQTGSWAAKST